MTAALGALAALAVTIGALLLGLQLLRRWMDRIGGRGERVPVRLLQRVSIGPRQAVGVLRVGERVLVVSMVEGGVHLLTELTGAERERALAPAATETAARRAPVGRLLRIGGLSLAFALAAAPGYLAAQDQGAAVQAVADRAVPAQFDMQVGGDDGGLHLSGTVGIVVLMGVMTMLPALFLLMTSFTRILIVLHFVRSAVGTPTAPPGQLLVVIAVVLTGMIMMPVMEEANSVALQPYLRGEMTQVEAYQQAIVPFRRFMLANTRDQELAVFTELTDARDAETIEDLPTVTIVSSFVTSELKTAFQMGFVVFLPFIVIDLVVAAVLMSMGMFMLPPVMVSLPFKLMLFVLADGWGLIMRNLVLSFQR